MVTVTDSLALVALARAIVERFKEDHPERVTEKYFEPYGLYGGAVDPNYHNRFEELTGHGRM